MPDMLIECPFCGKQTIKVFEKPVYRAQDHQSQYCSKRGGGLTVLCGCSACGKSLKEVKKMI